MTPEALPEATSISLSLPDTMTFEQWEAVGAELANRAKKLNWWIGDWWAAGHHRYGDRARLAARGLFGKEFKTLANIASVCRAFEPSRRREDLSWSHHAEAAALSPNAADMLLDLAERDKMSKAQVRAAVTTIRGGAPARPGSAELAGLYRAYNRLSPALRMEVARALAAVAASGADIDPDTGLVRAPEPETVAETGADLPEDIALELEVQAAADTIIDHDAIPASVVAEAPTADDIFDLSLESAEPEAETADTSDDVFIPPAGADWDAADEDFAPRSPILPAAMGPVDHATVLDLEAIAPVTDAPLDRAEPGDDAAYAGASEAILALESVGEETGESAIDASDPASQAGASEAILDLEALGVPLPDHAPEPVLDLTRIEGGGDVLDLGELAQPAQVVLDLGETEERRPETETWRPR